MLKSDILPWSEIKDFGLSYSGTMKTEYMYYLYFSNTILDTKNEYRKKLTRKTIKINVIGDDYYDVISKVIPYCKDKTNAELFIGKDKYYF